MGKRTCSIDGCDGSVSAKGWCNKHYLRWRRHGDPSGGGDFRAPMKGNQCAVDGCPRSAVTRGWCKIHYARWSRNGDPLVAKSEVKMPRGLTKAEILEMFTESDGDCLIWNHSLTGGGYGCLSYQGTTMRAHRVAFELHYGDIPAGKVIDHSCWNRACVNPDHLRAVTAEENGRYRSPGSFGTNTGYRNVSRTRSGKYKVQMRAGGENRHIGLYDTLDEAVTVATRLRRELFGDFAGASGPAATEADDD